MMVVVGDKVQFDPFETATGYAAETLRGNLVEGTVVLANYAHKWFSVEYDCGGGKQRTSFNFCDIGEAVKVCG